MLENPTVPGRLAQIGEHLLGQQRVKAREVVRPVGFEPITSCLEVS